MAVGSLTSLDTASRRWDDVPRKKKGVVFLTLGFVTLLALIIGLLLIQEINDVGPGSGDPFITRDNCDDFRSTNQTTDLDFTIESVECRVCDDSLGTTLTFSGCDGECTDWVYDVDDDVLEADSSTCDFDPPPEPPVFECPDEFYSTVAQTGCSAGDLVEFRALQDASLASSDEVSECFAACEAAGDDCYGVAIVGNGVGCLAITAAGIPFCEVELAQDTFCKRIIPSYQCVLAEAGIVNYAEAVQECVDLGGSLVEITPAVYNVDLLRLIEACGDRNCWFDSDNVDEDNCYYTDTSSDDGFGFGSCDVDRYYCCELETAAPTLSPTSSPTATLFYIPSTNETSWEDAEDECQNTGGELASIQSDEEHELASSLCAAGMEAFDNDCGCWIGLNRLSADVSANPLLKETFTYTDGFDQADYDIWEDGQPNNLGSSDVPPRDEACVHIRPFSDFHANDLPCEGYCDAQDTKPIPLCRIKTEAPTASPTVSPTKFPTLSPTQSPSQSPTESPTNRPTKSPTLSPTEEPTRSPTLSPTKNPTESPTLSPTKNPTESPTLSPTEEPTRSPTQSPTMEPTRSPTESPTKEPTQSPSLEPTESPTQFPTKSPTVSPTPEPTVSPTKSPTLSPTLKPTVSPSESPTNSPTESPSESPTNRPTESPTLSPTEEPTRSPTLSPTEEPTGSPTVAPFSPPNFEGKCKYTEEEVEYTVRNRNYREDYPFSFIIQFANPFFPGGTVPPQPDFLQACSSLFCFTEQKFLEAGETFTFVLPVSVITVFELSEFCGTPEDCQYIIRAADDLPECQCPAKNLFFDDFDSYKAANGLTVDDDETFFESWEVSEGGTIDIKGLLEDGETPASNFYFNPCLNDGQCVDLDGTVHVKERDENTLSLPPGVVTVEPVDTFYQRVCTLNFWASGNRRCGELHAAEGITGNNARERGCVQYYNEELVPLRDDVTAAIEITPNGTSLGAVTFEDIPWDQEFEPYGLTVHAEYDLNANVSALFTVVGGTLKDDLNIGPMLDDVDFTCCCPAPDDRFAGYLVDVDQGLASDGEPVVEHRSDPLVVIGKEPSYQSKTVFSLGLDGEVTYGFNLGFTDYIYIYEESFPVCCNKKDYEDAEIYVSVDGINWERVASSLKNTWEVFVPTDLTNFDRSLRYSKVDLPNGACYKYVKIVDKSEGDCDAADGFDLHAIVVGEPCCPFSYDPLPAYQEPALPAGSIINQVGGASKFMFVVAAMGVCALLALTVLTLQASRLKKNRLMRKESDAMQYKLEKEKLNAVYVPEAQPKDMSV